MPAGFLGNAGDDVTVFALADHQCGVIGSIGLEVADGREEYLVPAALAEPGRHSADTPARASRFRREGGKSSCRRG